MNYCPHPERPPVIRVTITPLFSNNADSGAEAEAEKLFIHLVLEDPHCPAHRPLFLYETYYGNVPAHPYQESDVDAFDSAGPLQLSFTKPDKNKPDQKWRVNRTTERDVHLRFIASPRKVDITTPIGPRVDMRRDQGGLIGCGRWFLPRPVGDKIYRHVVEWDLSSTPAGTRAVWSFGEGPSPVRKDGKSDVLANSVFMVGPVKSYPNPGAEPGRDDDASVGPAAGSADASRANIYWFGSLPGNLSRLNAYSTALFPKLAAFFRTVNASYRVFIRRVVRGFGGGACLDSYVLEYDDNSWKETDHELISLFSHEMVHSFTMMGFEANGYNNGWYVEGIAELYSAYLPYRFGLCGVQYLRERLNSSLSSYGTSPRIEMDVLESQQNFYDDWYAELIPYARGCTYLLKIDSRLRKMTGRFGLGQNSPLDDIIIDMGRRWRGGEQLQAKDWLKYLRPYLGDVTHEFQNMLRGKVLDLSNTIIIHKNWSLTPGMHEILEFGFDKSSIDKRIVSGTVPNSRAAEAGLEDELRLLSISRAGICSKSLSANLHMLVEQRGVKTQITYWPRSFNKGKVWQLED
ncbi:hypothetical protein BDW74DRAFT_182571 [Aspergillus multicolor]|uniref:uncharacterized protein n=1 Tax=Aspergillus multicolor TaxID=41759 RepID=UPI003CCD3484